MQKSIAIATIIACALIGATSAMANGNIYTSGYSGWERNALDAGTR